MPVAKCVTLEKGDVTAVMLSLWDNIMGPRLEFVRCAPVFAWRNRMVCMLIVRLLVRPATASNGTAASR